MKICQSWKWKFTFFSSIPTCHLFFKDFPDTFMAILVGLVGKSMRTSVRTTSLLISTDKRMLYKELYKSCTSFQIPKVGLTEEISLCKSTLFFFLHVRYNFPSPTSPFYLKSALTLPLTRVSCAMLHIFLEMTGKLCWALSTSFKSLCGRIVLSSFCSQCCLCGCGGFFQYFS